MKRIIFNGKQGRSGVPDIFGLTKEKFEKPQERDKIWLK